MDWYYITAAEQRGPASSELLISMISSGELPSSVLVWTEGMNDFVSASDVPELASLIAAALAPPVSTESLLNSGEADQMKIARQTYLDLLDMAVVNGSVSPRQGAMLAAKRLTLGLSPTDPEILGLEAELLGTTLDVHLAEQVDISKSAGASETHSTFDSEPESAGKPRFVTDAVPVAGPVDPSQSQATPSEAVVLPPTPVSLPTPCVVTSSDACSASNRDPSVVPPGIHGLKLKAGLLGILLGWTGAHKFVLGYTEEGVIQLVFSLVTCGAFGIVGLIEGIVYLSMSDGNFAATYVTGRKSWF